MPRTLSSYLMLQMQNEAKLRADVSCPVLIWASAQAPAAEQIWRTEAGKYSTTLPVPGEPLIFQLKKEEGKSNPFAMGVTVGRNENNDVVLDHPSISRFHAYFQRDARSKEWKLVDAESRNGTWCGPMKLPASQAASVPDGTRLRFGDLELQYMEPPSFLTYLTKQLKR